MYRKYLAVFAQVFFFYFAFTSEILNIPRAESWIKNFIPQQFSRNKGSRTKDRFTSF